MKTNNGSSETLILPEHVFAMLGDKKIAYLKAIESEQVPELFPQAPAIAPGMKLWALLGADGTPIMLTDSRDAAIAGAMENSLETVSVH